MHLQVRFRRNWTCWLVRMSYVAYLGANLHHESELLLINCCKRVFMFEEWGAARQRPSSSSNIFIQSTTPSFLNLRKCQTSPFQEYSILLSKVSCRLIANHREDHSLIAAKLRRCRSSPHSLRYKFRTSHQYRKGFKDCGRCYCWADEGCRECYLSQVLCLNVIVCNDDVRSNSLRPGR
jgi:hypothetical protein